MVIVDAGSSSIIGSVPPRDFASDLLNRVIHQGRNVAGIPPGESICDAFFDVLVLSGGRGSLKDDHYEDQRALGIPSSLFDSGKFRGKGVEEETSHISCWQCVLPHGKKN